MSPGTPVAVILAAGEGRRLGGPGPKQFALLLGRPVVLHVVELHRGLGHRLVVVVPPGGEGEVARILAGSAEGFQPAVVPGSSTRRASVLAGLAAAETVPGGLEPGTPVLLHNAASPNTPTGLVTACLGALDGHDGAQAVLPAETTVIEHEAGLVSRVLPRPTTALTADPTVYRADLARSIRRELAHAEPGGTTLDVALALGARIALVDSPPENLKLTLPGDLARLADLMSEGPDR